MKRTWGPKMKKSLDSQLKQLIFYFDASQRKFLIFFNLICAQPFTKNDEIHNSENSTFFIFANDKVFSFFSSPFMFAKSIQ